MNNKCAIYSWSNSDVVRDREGVKLISRTIYVHVAFIMAIMAMLIFAILTLYKGIYLASSVSILGTPVLILFYFYMHQKTTKRKAKAITSKNKVFNMIICKLRSEDMESVNGSCVGFFCGECPNENITTIDELLLQCLPIIGIEANENWLIKCFNKIGIGKGEIRIITQPLSVTKNSPIEYML